MDVILARHTSVGVPKGTCYGFSDVPVADTFEAEAAETKRRLEGLTFDAVYSSPLTRARKLASFCGWPEPYVDDRLKEMNMGEWEMRKFDEIDDPNLQLWYDDYMHLAATGGESFPELYHRGFSIAFCCRKRGIKSILSSCYLPLCLAFFFSCRMANWRSFSASFCSRLLVFRSSLHCSCWSFNACCAFVPMPLSCSWL